MEQDEKNMSQKENANASANLSYWIVLVLLTAISIPAFGILGTIGALCFYGYARSKKYQIPPAIIAAAGVGFFISVGQNYILLKSKALAEQDRASRIENSSNTASVGTGGNQPDALDKIIAEYPKDNQPAQR